MTPMTCQDLGRTPGDLRRHLRDGRLVPVTFHGKEIGRVVPTDTLEAVERGLAELAKLRATLAERGDAAA